MNIKPIKTDTDYRLPIIDYRLPTTDYRAALKDVVTLAMVQSSGVTP